MAPDPEGVLSAAARQIGLERSRVDRIVEDEQDALALMAQAFHDGGDRRLLLVVRADPGEADAECDQVGA